MKGAGERVKRCLLASRDLRARCGGFAQFVHPRGPKRLTRAGPRDGRHGQGDGWAEITEVDADVPGDTWFPEFDRSEWREREVSRHAADDRHAYPFRIVVLDRKRP